MEKEKSIAYKTENTDLRKRKHKESKPVTLLVMIVGILLVFIIVSMLISISYFKYDLFNSAQRIVSVHQYGNYENNDRWVVSDTKCCKIKCVSIYNPYEKSETEEYMKYLKFSNNKKASKAYTLLKENGYYNITEEGENYFIGWEEGVQDASIKEMVCLYDNMIVSAEIYVVSEWARSEDDTSQSAWEYPERKQFVFDNFVR